MILLSGADLIDGTPILDVKPYIQSYDNPSKSIIEDTVQNDQNSRDGGNMEFSDTKPIISEPDWVKSSNFPDLKVNLTETAWEQLQNLKLSMYEDKQQFLNTIIELLRADPRSVYRKEKSSDRLFFTNVDDVHVTAWFDDKTGEDGGKVRAEILRLVQIEQN